MQDENQQVAVVVSREPSTTAKVASFILDVIPIVGTIKSGIQVITGKDLVTGEEVNRAVELLGVLPIGKAFSILGKGVGKILGKELGAVAKEVVKDGGKIVGAMEKEMVKDGAKVLGAVEKELVKDVEKGVVKDVEKAVAKDVEKAVAKDVEKAAVKDVEKEAVKSADQLKDILSEMKMPEGANAEQWNSKLGELNKAVGEGSVKPGSTVDNIVKGTETRLGTDGKEWMTVRNKDGAVVWEGYRSHDPTHATQQYFKPQTGGPTHHTTLHRDGKYNVHTHTTDGVTKVTHPPKQQTFHNPNQQTGKSVNPGVQQARQQGQQFRNPNQQQNTNNVPDVNPLNNKK